MLNNAMLNQFAKGEPVLLEGYLLTNESASSSESEYLSIQVFPGMIIDINKKDALSVEQATDQVTGRTLIKISLSENAEVKSFFQLRLARMALASGSIGVPFSFGQMNSGPVFTSVNRLIDPVGGYQGGRGVGVSDTTGERDTYSSSMYTGPATKDDREPYSDIQW